MFHDALNYVQLFICLMLSFLHEENVLSRPTSCSALYDKKLLLDHIDIHDNTPLH